jgi:hypothetical protein
MRRRATSKSKRRATVDRTYGRSTTRMDRPARAHRARCQASWTGFARSVFLANRFATSPCSGLKGSIPRRATFATLPIPDAFKAIGKDFVSGVTRDGDRDQRRGRLRHRGFATAGGVFERSVGALSRPTLGNPFTGIRLRRAPTAAPLVPSAGDDMTAPACVSRETLR